MKKFKTFEEELAFLKKQVSKLPPIPQKQDDLLDKLADLLAEDFLDKFNNGKLHKPEKRVKQSVRK